MTKSETLDSFLGEHLKDVRPDIYVLILDAMTEYTQQQAKLFDIKPFNSEEGLLHFINLHIPFAIKPINKNAKTMLVYPFSSNNAQKIVTEQLAKSLFNVL